MQTITYHLIVINLLNFKYVKRIIESTMAGKYKYFGYNLVVEGRMIFPTSLLFDKQAIIALSWPNKDVIGL